MKVLIAPDSFKESLSATQVADIISDTLEKHGITTKKLPVADGGEGTTDSLVHSLGGTMHTVRVHNPLGKKITASYGIVNNTAIIEMATSSGLMLIRPNERNPMTANTYGLGEVIVDALDKGVNHIIMGIGGSATNDGGGVGMLMALGVQFLDKNNTPITDLPAQLSNISHINTACMDKRLNQITIDVACDVNNPLLGNNGAMAIYGPQKGVSPDMHTILENGLHHFAHISEKHLNAFFSHIAGTGASGGLGYALVAFLGAKLTSGIDLILKTVEFDTYAQWADIIITGEGKIDHQTINGKTPAGVAKHALKYKKPTIVIAGSIQKGWESLHKVGVKQAYAITPKGMDLETALRTAPKNLQKTTENIIVDLHTYIS